MTLPDKELLDRLEKQPKVLDLYRADWVWRWNLNDGDLQTLINGCRLMLKYKPVVDAAISVSEAYVALGGSYKTPIADLELTFNGSVSKLYEAVEALNTTPCCEKPLLIWRKGWLCEKCGTTQSIEGGDLNV